MRIDTDRLVITGMEQPDPAHLRVMNDIEWMQFSEQRHFVHNHTLQQEHLDRLHESERTSYPSFLFFITNGANVVGSMGATLDLNNKRVDQSIMIFPQYAKQGYGQEAWEGMMKYWLDPVRGGMWKVEAGHMNGNDGMQRICEKSGMSREGERLDHFIWNDPRPGSGMALLRSVVLWGMRR